ENQKQQHYVDAVQNDIGEMMSSRIQVKQLIVNSMRNPRQRMPVRGVECRERPADRAPVQSRLYVTICCDVHIVVVVHETILIDGLVERESTCDEEKTHNQIPLRVRSERAGR